MALFDCYFWPFNMYHEKFKSIFVIIAIILSYWNVFIKFCWRDEILMNGPIAYILTYRINSAYILWNAYIRGETSFEKLLCEPFQLWFSRSTYRHFATLLNFMLTKFGTYIPLHHYVGTISNEILSIGMPTWHLIWIAHT